MTLQGHSHVTNGGSLPESTTTRATDAMSSLYPGGGNLRQQLCRDLGFSSKDLHETIWRTRVIGKLMAKSGIIFIWCLISPFDADRQKVR